MTLAQRNYVLNLRAKKLKPLIKEHEDSQSRNQSPPAGSLAGNWSPGETLGNWNLINF